MTTSKRSGVFDNAVVVGPDSTASVTGIAVSVILVTYLQVDFLFFLHLQVNVAVQASRSVWLKTGPLGFRFDAWPVVAYGVAE